MKISNMNECNQYPAGLRICLNKYIRDGAQAFLNDEEFDRLTSLSTLKVCSRPRLAMDPTNTGHTHKISPDDVKTRGRGL